MNRAQQLTAVIRHDGNGFVAICPELDIVGRGRTVDEARLNLVKAAEKFFALTARVENRRRPQR